MAKRRRSKGEGSLWWDKTNSRWMGKITLPSGKRRTKSGKSKKEVLDWLTDQRNKIKNNTVVEDDAVTLGEFLTSYLENVAQHNLRPRTFIAHRGYAVNHIIPALGKIKLVNLRPDHVQEFYTRKLDEGLAPRTVYYLHTILHKTLDQAVRWGRVTRNVTDLVDAPRPKSKPPKILSASQINRFLEETKGHRYYPMYVLAAYCGMRQSEIIGLYVSDVNLEKGTIQVRRTIQWVRGKGFVIQDVKTDKSRRLIDVPEFALNVLKEHMATVEGHLLFTASTGNPVYNNNLYRHFKQTLKKAGLPDVTFHSLRHSHATLLLIAGVHPKVVQERLGHGQISTTLDLYSQTVPSMGKDAAEKFNSLLDAYNDA